MKLFFTARSLAFDVREEGLPRQAVFRVALIVSLHLGLFWLLTRPAQRPAIPDNRVWLQLLQPALPVFIPRKTVVAPEPDVRPAPRLAAPRLTAPRMAAQPPASATVVPPAQSATIAEGPEERALLAEPAAAKAAASTLPADILQQALKSVGAIDRQLRAEHKQEFSAPPDTPLSRLSKGFAQAHAAVGPKWYQAARTELISAPNDPRRIYRITTALGEYCVYFPDKASIAENGSAKAGWAGFGQPTVAGCPIPF